MNVQKKANDAHLGEYYMHFSNWAQCIYHPLDPSNGPFPHIESVNWDNHFMAHQPVFFFFFFITHLYTVHVPITQKWSPQLLLG